MRLRLLAARPRHADGLHPLGAEEPFHDLAQHEQLFDRRVCGGEEPNGRRVRRARLLYPIAQARLDVMPRRGLERPRRGASSDGGAASSLSTQWKSKRPMSHIQ